MFLAHGQDLDIYSMKLESWQSLIWGYLSVNDLTHMLQTTRLRELQGMAHAEEAVRARALISTAGNDVALAEQKAFVR